MQKNSTSQSQIDNGNENKEDPKLLQILRLILRDIQSLQEEAKAIHIHFQEKYGDKKDEDIIKDMAVKKIIKRYSNYTAFWGGATALTGVVPGIGSIVAMLGGAGADMVLSMKFQIEMVMEIATVYGHDITQEDIKDQCLIVAGLAAINKMAKEATGKTTSRAFIKMTQSYLKGPTLKAVKQVFIKVGITFSRKSLQKVIPFGIGVVIGYNVNKIITKYVGKRAKEHFSIP